MVTIHICKCCERKIRTSREIFRSKCGCFYHVNCIKTKISSNSLDIYNCDFCNQKICDIHYSGIHTNETNLFTEEEFRKMIEDNYESFLSNIDEHILRSEDTLYIASSFGAIIIDLQ